MNVHHTLICFFFLSGNTGLINTEIITMKEGENFRHECKFFFSGSCQAFDKEGNNKAEPGRCSIEFTPEPISSVLYVSITNLIKSDSGKYRCVLKRDYFLESTEEFELRVEDAENTGRNTEGITIITGNEGGNIGHECTFTFSGSRKALYKENSSLIETEEDKAERGRYSIELSPEPTYLYASITNLMESDSGLYKCILDPLHSTDTFEIRVVPYRAGGILLYVCLILVIVVLVSSTAVLIYCRTRASKAKGPPEETEYASVTEAGPVYEEIREEDGWNRSPPVEISTVYTYAKFDKPNAAEGSDDYSFVTAAQKETEDNSSKPTYSVVDSSNGAPASLNSAPPGDADDVVTPGPGVAANLDGHHDEHPSTPL
ncbi:hypothetical protein D5F01_LYC07829 [Larimichthys crocea]|uniref:Immunoglobulin subtype domain-containing protein n=1 Tax=Larimichthys crocea TaxID=215358 RepID=A0A6G0IN24_LARCR|nr:hypothetical protein D5F01_LYC07829 [Larimichthys crocea]